MCRTRANSAVAAGGRAAGQTVASAADGAHAGCLIATVFCRCPRRRRQAQEKRAQRETSERSADTGISWGLSVEVNFECQLVLCGEHLLVAHPNSWNDLFTAISYANVAAGSG